MTSVAFFAALLCSCGPKPLPMTPTVLHHIVSFPDCRLEFDYPADLKPSPDFVTQRLESAVDYATIPWVASTASTTFVEMHSDLVRDSEEDPLSTVSIEMWLGTTPTGFNGNVTVSEDLERSIAMQSKLDGQIPYPTQLVEINGRVWVHLPDVGNYISGLNSRYYMRAMVSVVGRKRSSKAQAQAQRTFETVIGSLRIVERSEPKAGSTTP